MTDISNSDDVIDSRDVIARLEELRADREAWEPTQDVDGHTWAVCYPDEAAELAALEALADEAEGCGDWEHGETLIRDSYFEDYARELAEDCGMMRDTDAWPYTCIDWERAARELRMDYTSVDFDGVTYWVRS